MTKTALLVSSFGTSYHDTAEKNIIALEQELAEAFPDYHFYRSFSSPTIRKKLRERDQLKVYSVEEALEQIVADGCDSLLVQPGYLVSGLEFHRLKLALATYRDRFKWIKLGLPLLPPQVDLSEFASALKVDLEKSSDEVALLYMGHGTKLANDHVYRDLTNIFRRAGYEHAYIATIEGKEGLDEVLAILREHHYKEIHLLPLMLVAGDHAKNDMVGDDPNSWRSILLRKGWQVSYELRGLGELESIRTIFVERARKAQEFTD